METAITNPDSSPASQEDRMYWESHIKAQRASEISRAAYCRINHINYAKLTYWLKNNKQTHQDTARIIPVKLKSSVDHKSNPVGSRVLCTLRFNNGVTLSIHEKEVLCLVLGEMM